MLKIITFAITFNFIFEFVVFIGTLFEPDVETNFYNQFHFCHNTKISLLTKLIYHDFVKSVVIQSQKKR